MFFSEFLEVDGCPRREPKVELHKTGLEGLVVENRTLEVIGLFIYLRE
jgi:hypothetical protein